MTTNTIVRAQEQQQERLTLVQVVQRMQPEIARALPKGMDADRMARLALTVIRQTPGLAECSAESFAGALLTASALGLEPGVDGEAYLVPYGGECTFIAGFKGFSKLFFQHPLARHLDAQAVHENDLFDYEYGLDPHLRHRPARKDRGEITDYYAVASLSTGARFLTVLSPEEVTQIRGASGRRRGNIPDPMHWMQRKTALRQLLKLTPKTTMLAHALVADERSGSDLTANRIPEAIAEGRTPAIEAAPDEPEAVPESSVVNDWPAVAEIPGVS